VPAVDDLRVGLPQWRTLGRDATVAEAANVPQVDGSRLGLRRNGGETGRDASRRGHRAAVDQFGWAGSGAETG